MLFVEDQLKMQLGAYLETSWSDMLHSMMNGIDIGDIVLFGVLAFLALGYLQYIFFPSPGQASGMGEVMALIFSFPLAVGGVVIGLVKYRLWRSMLFWMLLVVSALAVFGGSQNNIVVRAGDVRSALFTDAPFAPVIAIPLWQIIMAVVAFFKSKKYHSKRFLG